MTQELTISYCLFYQGDSDGATPAICQIAAILLSVRGYLPIALYGLPGENGRGDLAQQQ